MQIEKLPTVIIKGNKIAINQKQWECIQKAAIQMENLNIKVTITNFHVDGALPIPS